MQNKLSRRQVGKLMLASIAAGVTQSRQAFGQEGPGGYLRVGIFSDATNWDPQSWANPSYAFAQNLYGSLVNYTEDGKVIPVLATEWQIAEDRSSITLTLRDGVTFASGAPMTSADVVATLEKGADPNRGDYLFQAMAIVESWEAPDERTIVLRFKGPRPDMQITDLLQFIKVIEASGIDTVKDVPAGTGPYKLESRAVGQNLVFRARPDYWGGRAASEEVTYTLFSDVAASAAALESGAIDMVWGVDPRTAVRLEGAGFKLWEPPAAYTLSLQINTTRAPFTNKKFRQAMLHLVDREGIRQAGYAGRGTIVALPWGETSPAYDATYTEKYAFDLEKGRALIQESGISPEEAGGWSVLVNGNQQEYVLASQILQSTLADIGITIGIDLRNTPEYLDTMFAGNYDVVFGRNGNTSKFPSRITLNSIFKTPNNAILGEPHPHPAYVAAIDRVNSTIGDEATMREAYDNLNRVLLDEVFAVPIVTANLGRIVAAPNVEGFTYDPDELLVLKNIKVER